MNFSRPASQGNTYNVYVLYLCDVLAVGIFAAALHIYLCYWSTFFWEAPVPEL